MTGSEIPAAKIALETAKKILGDKDDKAALQRLAAETPEMKSAAEAYAKRVEIKQSALLKLYQPLGRLLGASKEYFSTDFHGDMARKLSDIPDEHLVTPSPSVAIPAMEGLGYSFEEPDLKEMYLNLLATATDARSKDEAHPSFADIIKQLSPEEATHLLDVLRTRILPIARLNIRAEDGAGELVVETHLIEMRQRTSNDLMEHPSMPVWVDNWIRLGLIEVDYARHLTADGRYDWVKETPQFARVVETDPRGPDAIKVAQGILTPTAFGRRFLSAVSYDGVVIDVVEAEPLAD